jgi:hypothetical protein
MPTVFSRLDSRLQARLTLLKKATIARQHSQEWLCHTFCQQFAKP